MLIFIKSGHNKYVIPPSHWIKIALRSANLEILVQNVVGACWTYTQLSVVSKERGLIAMDVDKRGERGQFLSMFKTYVTRSWDGKNAV